MNDTKIGWLKDFCKCLKEVLRQPETRIAIVVSVITTLIIEWLTGWPHTMR